jgi:hypothetical protein
MKSEFHLVEDSRGKLTLCRPGRDDETDVTLRRAFPWSAAGRFVSIRGSEGKELMLIDDVAGLSAELGALIERNLDATVFIPRITRIESVDVRFGYQQWKVQTDRGPAEFRVQEREDIRFHADGRFSLKDADGTVYELPRLDELDEHSQKALRPLV